jgi:phospholipase C
MTWHLSSMISAAITVAILFAGLSAGFLMSTHVGGGTYRTFNTTSTNQYASATTATSSLTFLSSNTLTSISTLDTLPGSTPIQHIVIVMQENRAFDNYFWTYPNVIGGQDQYPNLCMNNPDGSCIPPYYQSNPVQHDMPHTQHGSLTAWDNGTMGGFIANAIQGGESPMEPMGYYNASDIPFVWKLAQHYVLADQFFSSTLSYSQPNHWYMLAGNTPAVSISEMGNTEKDDCVSGMTIIWGTCSYINQAQSIQTIVDSAQAHSISWKYYNTIPSHTTLSSAIVSGTAFDYWDPLLAKNSTYSPSYFSNFVPRSQFFTDVKDGELPQVSWIIPSPGISDHPPANVTIGEYWIAAVTDAVMNSPYWENTAIIITWDDFGGWFDTVPPPQLAGQQLGFRVPALIVSAYSSQPGYVDHTVYSFESMLKFIEYTFNLPPLTDRDSSTNNMLNAFNFNQAPQAPFVQPLTPSELNALNRYVSIGTGFECPPYCNNMSYYSPSQIDSNNLAILAQFIAGDAD